MSEEMSLYGRDQYAIMERVLIVGDLEKLTPSERVSYYMQTCESLGLNPLTRPFDYIKLTGRGLTLYARKDCTDQLRARHRINIDPPQERQLADVFIVTVTARTTEGRTDSDMGVVAIKGLSGNDLANAIMRAITKAKRRVTLSICGLGWLDEAERDTLPRDARTITVDPDTGEILGGAEEFVAQEAAPPSSSGNERMTEPQHRSVEALIARSGLDREDFKNWLVAERMLASGGHLTDLSKKIVSSMIDRWDDVLYRYQNWMIAMEPESERRE